MTDKTGGKAFPSRRDKWFESGTVEYYDDGMTLRDYFAAKAMQALVSKHGNGEGRICMEAYKIADVMLAARSKQ